MSQARMIVQTVSKLASSLPARECVCVCVCVCVHTVLQELPIATLFDVGHNGTFADCARTRNRAHYNQQGHGASRRTGTTPCVTTPCCVSLATATANDMSRCSGLCGASEREVVPRGLEPRTLRLLAVRSNQLSYETICFKAAILILIGTII